MTGLPPNHNCELCDLHKTTRRVCTPGEGDKESHLVIIGEAPGAEEERSGRPFSGRSGQLLRTELDNARIGSRYITNLVKCRPPNNEQPTAEQIKACRPYLDYELSQIKPSHVLTLGSPATKYVLKESKITTAHGKLVKTQEWTGIAAYHPAYVLRDPNRITEFRTDLNRLAKDMRGEKTDNRVPWDIVNKDTLDEFISQFIKADEFAFDCETGGLFQYLPEDHPNNYISCIGIALKEQSWVIPGSVKGSPFPFEAQKKLIRLLTELAHSMGKVGIAQNGKFDNIWISTRYGVRFPLNFDIMLAHYLIDENTPHDLEFISRQHLDVEAYDIPLSVKQGKGNLMTMMEYNAKDAGYTLRLYPILRDILKKDPSQWKLFELLIMPASEALEKVEKNGLWVNLEKMESAMKQTAIELNKTLSTLNKMVGKNVNWNSSTQVGEILFGRLKLPIPNRTAKGKPSTGEASLVALKDKHPVAELLVKYRELEKFRGTYLEGWQSLMVGNHLHFSYKIHGTVTGRWSSRLHQTPRDGTIRNIVTAPPGWTFMQGDFSQAELNIVAQVSEDPEMLRCFREGVDIHWRTLLYVIQAGGAGEYVQPAIDTAVRLGCRKDKAESLPVALSWLEKAGHERCTIFWKGWKEARKKAKGINFGYVYGMKENKFIEYAKLKYGFEPTYDEARSIREAYFRLYRGLNEWHNRQKKLVHLNESVRNLIGRIRHLPTIKSPDRSLSSEAERQSINAPIQGVIGDLKSAAFIELTNQLDPDLCKVVGEVHDSILFWIKTDQLNSELKGVLFQGYSVLKQIVGIMENPRIFRQLGVRLDIPVKCELEYGDWGQGIAIDRKILIG